MIGLCYFVVNEFDSCIMCRRCFGVLLLKRTLKDVLIHHIRILFFTVWKTQKNGTWYSRLFSVSLSRLSLENQLFFKDVKNYVELFARNVTLNFNMESAK